MTRCTLGLVAGDGVRGEHDDVVAADLDELVLVAGHEREGAHGLALGAGADDADLARRVAADLVGVDHPVGGKVEESHLAGQV